MRAPAIALPALLVVTSIAAAQCAPSAWRSMGRPDFPALHNATTLWDPDGTGPAQARLAFGDANGFGTIGTWDGSSWEEIPSDAPGELTALSVWNGDLVKAADYSTVFFGPPVSGVARYTSTGWQPLGGVLNWRVNVLAVYNGELIAAGGMTVGSPTLSANIVRWDGTSWQPLGAGVGGSLFPGVSSLVVFNGELIVGGNFVDAGGVAVGSIAKWNGSAWQALGPDAGTWGVSRLAVYAGELIAAGNAFQHAGANVALNIARWDGTQWQSLGSGLDGSVASMTQLNGDLIVGGGFMTAGGVSASGVARWDGTAWHSIGTVATGASAVAPYGGELIAARAQPTGFVRWDGTSWQPLGAIFNGGVCCLATFDDDLVAGGQFTANGGVGNRVARWNGASWQPLGAGLDGLVDAFTVFNGELVAGGNFAGSGGVAVDDVARWTGSAWAPLGPGSALGGWGVAALTVYNGELIAGGYLETAGGVPVNGIARWNGASWQPLGSGVTLNGSAGQVFALAVFNGDLIAGGLFDAADGVAVNAIARWDGTAWHALGSGVTWGAWPSSYGEVGALAVANGQLFVGGDFYYAGGVPASNIASWDGTAWHPLGAGVDGNSAFCVWALAHSGTELFAGGRLWSAGGVPAYRVARWDGTSWSPLGMGCHQNWVRALTIHHGALVAGGDFTRAGTFAVPYLARWSSPLPFLAVSQPNGAGAGVQVRNAWLEAGHEYYNLASLDVAPGAPGSGPYGGLWFSDVSTLISQLAMPLGTAPFHVQAGGATATWGPYVIPPGITFEAIAVDVTGGALGCISTTLRYTTY